MTVATRAEELAIEIRRGCDHATDEADALVGLEVTHRFHPTAASAAALEKQRRRLSHSLMALNGPIRAYHELLHPEMRLTPFQRFVRWVADLGARGATFRRRQS